MLEPRHEKTNKMNMRPAKTQISLGICPVWSESSLCTEWVAKDPTFLHANSEDSDQTGQMPRLIWVFDGRTLILLVFSCRGSLDLVYSTTVTTLLHSPKDQSCHQLVINLSRSMTKPTNWPVRRAKTQISLGIRQSDQSLRCPHEESLGP